MRRSVLIAATLLAITGCDAVAGSEEPSDLTEPPEVGACRLLEPADVAKPTNDTEPVPCSEPHTAETFFVGAFEDGGSDEASGADTGDMPTDTELGAEAFGACQAAFMSFLGGDESLVKRSTLTWAWFGPSEQGWEQGARWFRCDAIGGGEQSKAFMRLPETVEGVLLGRPDDRWMVCAQGPTVAGSVKVPCDQPHDWRAISTVVLGQPDDPYPGDREVERTTREFCSDQVGAYLNYPVTDYDFGYTWFHEGEWEAGNRRSVCWAKTDR